MVPSFPLPVHSTKGIFALLTKKPGADLIYPVEDSPTSDEQVPGFSVTVVLVIFLFGLLVGYFGYFLYCRFARRKLIRTLYQSNITSETTPLCTDNPDVPGSRNNHLKNYSVSSPSLPLGQTSKEQSPNFKPVTPLPTIDTGLFESEARWRNFHKKKSLADTMIQHSTEPPLGYHLRMAVRSCLHYAEVSPESIAVDQAIHPFEAFGVTRFPSNINPQDRRCLAPSASLRAKFGHRSSKSTASIPSNIATLRGKAQDSYSNFGSVLVSGDSVRSHKVTSPDSSPFNPSGKATESKPLAQIFAGAEPSPSSASSSKQATCQEALPKGTEITFKKEPTSKRHDLRPSKSTLQIETNFKEKFHGDRVKAIKQDKGFNEPPPRFKTKLPEASNFNKPLLEPHFFSDETSHEWNLPNYGKIRFTDHAPVVFRLIRRYFGYSLQDFDRALSAPFGNVSSTAGKSEAIFFLTHNNAKFLFKTLRNSEPDNLKTLLPDYLEHIRRNPNTLLPRYLGMYTFERLSSVTTSDPPSGPNRSSSGFGVGTATMASIEAALAAAFPLSDQQTLPSSDDAFPQKMVLVIMANVFDTPLGIQERYDFKGSNVGRHTLPASATNIPPTLQERRQEVGHLTLKDLDFQYRVFQGLTNLIHLGPQSKEELMMQLEEDLGFLKKFALMDYSVLVGIHRSKKPTPSSPSMASFSPPTRDSRSRAGSVSSRNPGSHTAASPLTQPSIIQPFISSASNLINSILLPSANGTPTGKEPFLNDYFEDPFTRQNDHINYSHHLEADDSPIIWKNGVQSVRLPNPEIYFIGIIDILQKFTIVKWLEKGLKGYNTRLLGGPSPKAPLFGSGNFNSPIIGSPSLTSGSANSTDSSLNHPDVPTKPIPATHKSHIASSLPQSNTKPNLPRSTSEHTAVEVSPHGHSKGLQPTSLFEFKRSSSSPHQRKQTTKPTSTTPLKSPKSEVPRSKVFSFFPQQAEYSVEEPGRYAERLLEYIRGIVV